MNNGSRPCRSETPDRRLQAVIRFAERCRYESEHTRQVARLALALFDALQTAHGLAKEDRFLLRCAAILHDIGWLEGKKGHHKTALGLILNEAGLPFDDRERRLVGCIARYHRKALPNGRHAHFGSLSPADQERVRGLAGILRVADGLDRTHRDVVRSLDCDVTPSQVIIRCTTDGSAADETLAAADKGRLLEDVLDRELVFRMSRTLPASARADPGGAESRRESAQE